MGILIVCLIFAKIKGKGQRLGHISEYKYSFWEPQFVYFVSRTGCQEQCVCAFFFEKKEREPYIGQNNTSSSNILLCPETENKQRNNKNRSSNRITTRRTSPSPPPEHQQRTKKTSHQHPQLRDSTMIWKTSSDTRRARRPSKPYPHHPTRMAGIYRTELAKSDPEALTGEGGRAPAHRSDAMSPPPAWRHPET